MKHLVEIDDRSSAGRNLLELIKQLSKSSKGIDIVDADDDSDTVSFAVFAKELRRNVKSRLKKNK